MRTIGPPRGRWKHGGRVIVAGYMPHWLVVPATVLSGALVWWRVRDRRKSRAGRCPSCGYDLRATPNRCPECGTVPDVQAKTAA